MTGAEIDMIVKDSLESLELYEKVFEIKRVEVTSYLRGMNEAVFTLYGTRFHMLDENTEFGMNAPKPGESYPIWFNIVVPDIKATFENALSNGCTEIQPVTEMPDLGIHNAMFSDPFGYVWMLHQIDREVSFEERCRIMEEKMGIKPVE